MYTETCRPETEPALVTATTGRFLEEASGESTIFGFRPARFRKIRKAFFAAEPRRDAIFGEIARWIGQAIFGKSESVFEVRCCTSQGAISDDLQVAR